MRHQNDSNQLCLLLIQTCKQNLLFLKYSRFKIGSANIMGNSIKLLVVIIGEYVSWTGNVGTAICKTVKNTGLMYRDGHELHGAENYIFFIYPFLLEICKNNLHQIFSTKFQNLHLLQEYFKKDYSHTRLLLSIKCLSNMFHQSLIKLFNQNAQIIRVKW